MNISFLRSSSYNCHEMCPMQYYSEYVLGWRGPSNIKADKGTIVHKVLEVLALVKKAKQEKHKNITDDICGVVPVKGHDINKLVEQVFGYYSTHITQHNWQESDFKDCKNWVWKALQFDDGKFDPRNCFIVDAEPKFDIEIKEPWAMYQHGDSSNFLRLKGTIDLIVKVKPKVYEIRDWKGLPLDTPIPTITGWTDMESLKVGDVVFDINGDETIVTAKSKVKTKPCYKITFDDTSTVEADSEHRWKLCNNTVLTTTELKKRDSIYLTKPLKIKNQTLPIDPYLLGIWLGDGRNRSCEITSADQFVFKEIESRGYKVGNPTCKDRTPSRTIYNTTSLLRQLNLLHNKHIPLMYLRASYEQRLDLLRGLFDSDGSVNEVRKQAVFTNCNKKLSDDVKELLLSLGQRPYQANVLSRGFGLVVRNYPISFKPIDINPFLLPRKADRVKVGWGHGRSDKRVIVNIEYIGEKQTQCIQVSSPSKTYLCTKNMIPTHNTGRRLNWATGEEKTHAKLRDDPQLRIYHYAGHHLYNVDQILVTIFYINDGGPFTICYDKADLPETLDMLKEKFEEIKSDNMPKRKRSWKCSKLCHQGKSTFEGTNIEPITEFRRGHVCRKGDVMTKCEQLAFELYRNGMKQTTLEYTHPEHDIAFYQDPGGTK